MWVSTYVRISVFVALGGLFVFAMGTGPTQCAPIPVEPVAGPCDDGEPVSCNTVPPVCQDYEILAEQGGCYVCVNEETCRPWGEPECREHSDCPAGDVCDFCATSSCPFCDDCVAACVPGPVVGPCDDGEPIMCMMMPPVCQEHEILAQQGGCWMCVNEATCLPWGEPECREDADCAAGEICDGCATSSCPFCDDCVAACVPRPIQGPDCREFDYFQCGPMFTCENGIVQGEWHEHVMTPDGMEDIVGYTCETACERGCVAAVYEDWPEFGTDVVQALCGHP